MCNCNIAHGNINVFFYRLDRHSRLHCIIYSKIEVVPSSFASLPFVLQPVYTTIIIRLWLLSLEDIIV